MNVTYSLDVQFMWGSALLITPVTTQVCRDFYTSKCGSLNTISSYSFRAHPAISHCSHLLLKCRVATNISYWLKVRSRWFKNYISAKKCIWIFQYCFYYSFTLYYCAIFNSLNAGFFSKPSRFQTVWIQIRPNVMSGLIWVQTVCKG